jgi:hypothetical protein
MSLVLSFSGDQETKLKVCGKCKELFLYDPNKKETVCGKHREVERECDSPEIRGVQDPRYFLMDKNPYGSLMTVPSYSNSTNYGFYTIISSNEITSSYNHVSDSTSSGLFEPIY